MDRITITVKREGGEMSIDADADLRCTSHACGEAFGFLLNGVHRLIEQHCQNLGHENPAYAEAFGVGVLAGMKNSNDDELTCTSRVEPTMNAAAPTIPDGLKAWLASRNVTPRQAELVAHFAAFVADHGFSPTLNELAALLDVSKVSVWEMVAALGRKGILAKRGTGETAGRQARGLYLLYGAAAIDAGRLRAEAEIVRRVSEQIRKTFPGYANVLGEAAGRLEAAAAAGRDAK